ncbi:mRNA interferase MazF [Gammaproteobacteria bacterium]
MMESNSPGVTPATSWVPDRQEVIWLGPDTNSAQPFLVLSPRAFNERTALIIGLPMTNAEDNADNPFAVMVGSTKGPRNDKTLYIFCHQPKSFPWRTLNVSPHPLRRLPDASFSEVCTRLNQIIQLT